MGGGLDLAKLGPENAERLKAEYADLMARPTRDGHPRRGLASGQAQALATKYGVSRGYVVNLCRGHSQSWAGK